ncbi:MAG: metallophosphoesterase family protein [Deltaproteobacteria bacterium]|nr:metallophosphoesterase family protein [Deltaproteobacteria bacterium]
MVSRTATIPVHEGRLRLALVADTHSAPHAKTEERLRALEPTAILHAGDIGAKGVVDALEAIAPTHVVRGNIDGVANDWPDELVLTVEDAATGDTLFTVFLVHIAVYGPKLRGEIAKRARAAGAQIVVCGHSHVPFIGRDQGLTVMNPGSIGPRRFTLPIVFGVMELRGGKLALEHVSVETGERWLP